MESNKKKTIIGAIGALGIIAIIFGTSYGLNGCSNSNNGGSSSINSENSTSSASSASTSSVSSNSSTSGSSTSSNGSSSSSSTSAPHVHTSNYYVCGESQHYRICKTCGETYDYADHTSASGEIVICEHEEAYRSGSEYDGKKGKVCDVCGGYFDKFSYNPYVSQAEFEAAWKITTDNFVYIQEEYGSVSTNENTERKTLTVKKHGNIISVEKKNETARTSGPAMSDFEVSGEIDLKYYVKNDDGTYLYYQSSTDDNNNLVWYKSSSDSSVYDLYANYDFYDLKTEPYFYDNGVVVNNNSYVYNSEKGGYVSKSQIVTFDMRKILSVKRSKPNESDGIECEVSYDCAEITLPEATDLPE